jgi:hypothetical protein
MAKSILTLPAWKPLLAFIVCILFSQVIALAAAKYFNWSMDYGPYPTLRYTLIALILLTYPYFVGRALSRLAGSQTAHRRILWTFLLAIVNNVLSVYYTETYGLAWPVVLITLLVNIFCVIVIISFPARELKSIELKRNARFHEHFNELLQFMLWPFCVWRLQSRLAAIATQSVG